LGIVKGGPDTKGCFTGPKSGKRGTGTLRRDEKFPKTQTKVGRDGRPEESLDLGKGEMSGGHVQGAPHGNAVPQ